MTYRRMTEDEIRRLYAIAMAYDNRRPSEANVTAWMEQADRGRWTYSDASNAIHTHFMESTEYLMPAHITAILRRDRRQPAHSDTLVLPAAPPAEPERVKAIVEQLGEQLGWARTPDGGADPAPLAVECPHCHAGPQRPCTRFRSRGAHRGEYVSMRGFHPSRVEISDRMGEP